MPLFEIPQLLPELLSTYIYRTYAETVFVAFGRGNPS